MSGSSPRPAPTILYDAERRDRRQSSSSSGLAPPDLESLLSRKRSLTQRLLHVELPRRVQLPLTCLSIGLSAVQANGVYCWPTYGPVVARMMELDTGQAQTIVVGGILGVYLMAAPLGAFTDRHGPRAGSLISAALSLVGYQLFALVLRTSSPTTPYIHLALTACYFLIGAATVGSYFAALTCASLSFPNHPTLSLSLPLSLMSLSSLFLSSFSYLPIFLTSPPTSELKAPLFLTFLGTLCPIINLFSSLFMRVLPPLPLPLVPTPEPEDLTRSRDAEELSRSLMLDERTPLLIGGPEAAREEVEAMEKGEGTRWTAKGLVADWEGFWVFGLLLALCIGPAETIIASIGSILTSLLPPATSLLFPFTSSTTTSSPTPYMSLLSLAAVPQNALSLRNKHVRLLSLAGTLARLSTGFLADYLAPPLIAIPAPSAYTDSDDDESSVDSTGEPRQKHVYIRKRPVRLTRSSFAAIAAVVQGLVFAWCAGELESERGLWVLSAGTGALYGVLFTLTPAIVSAHFGPTNFGLAWGMVSYFPALGSVAFSYLYALLSEAASHPSASLAKEPALQCHGPECFRSTLWVSAAGSVLAGLGIFFIGRRWKV